MLLIHVVILLFAATVESLRLGLPVRSRRSTALSANPSHLLDNPRSFYCIHLADEIAALPRFREFCESHQYFSLGSSNKEVTINVLKGGEGAGPIAQTSKRNQLVRASGYFEGLEARPIWTDQIGVDPRLSWVSDLRDSVCDVLIEELEKKDADILYESLGSFGCNGEDTGWTQITLVDNFQQLNTQQQKFPQTMKILHDIVTPLRYGPRHTAIACQGPNSGIGEHADMMNWMLTMHLPFFFQGSPNDDVIITVDEQRIHWRVGQPTIIDTTFKHFTQNESNHPMLLLMVDFWHPDLSTDEINAIKRFFSLTTT